MIAGGPVIWRSRLQQTGALSSTETEYRATTEAGQEAIWLNSLLSSVMTQPPPLPIILHCDNLSAIDLADNTVFHGRTKHVEIHHHWIREQVKAGSIKLQYCKSANMVADMLTKPLHPRPFFQFQSLAGIIATTNVD